MKYPSVRTERTIRQLLMGLTAAGALAFWGSVVYRMWPAMIDDSWISFTYARNLAEGRGPVFFLGERVEGYSCPLWVALLALGRISGAGMLGWSKAMSVVFWAGGAIFLWGAARAGRRPGESTAVYGLAALALLATNPWANFWTMMGMETPLFTFLLAATVYLHIRWPDRPAWSAAAGLAALTRPEGAGIFVALLGVWLLFRLNSWRRGTALTALRLAAGFAAVVVPYQIFRMLYFRDLLPHTYYYKAASRYPQLAFEDYAGGWLAQQGMGLTGLMILLGFSAPGSLRRRALATALAGLAALVVFAAIFPDWMPGYRFLAPAAPLWALVVVLGLRRIDELLFGAESPLRGWVGGLVVPLTVILLASLGAARFQRLWAVEGWRALHGFDSRLDFGRWLREHTPKDTRIAYGDMGALPYASRRRFLDFTGLLNREAVRIRASSRGPTFRARLNEYVLGERPDLVIDAFRGSAALKRPEEIATSRIDIGFFLASGYSYAGSLTAYPPGRYPPLREGRTLAVLLRDDSPLYSRKEALREALQSCSRSLR